MVRIYVDYGEDLASFLGLDREVEFFDFPQPPTLALLIDQITKKYKKYLKNFRKCLDSYAIVVEGEIITDLSVRLKKWRMG
jgi:hypothetical protein